MVIIFEVIIASEIYNRFDTSHEYWEKFDVKKENLPKCLGYFGIEHISNLCVLTIACNPKEHYEVFEDRDVNNSLTNFDTFKKPQADYKEVSRLTVLDDEMQKKTVTKTEFLQFNEKQFFLPTELPPCLFVIQI